MAPIIVLAVLLFIVGIFVGVAQELDVRASENGYAMGYTEGNSLITGIFGRLRPDGWQLRAYNLAQAVLFCVPCAIWSENPAVVGATIGVMLACGGKHLVEALHNWPRVIATKGNVLTAYRPIWKKILGIY